MTDLDIVEKALDSTRRISVSFSWRFYCMALDGYLAKYLQESKS